MTPVAVRAAAACLRTWTRLYTWRMDPSLRDARREEIESDLWESQADRGRHSDLALQIVARLFFGMSADLRWRVEHDAAAVPHLRRAALLTLGTIAALFFVWVATAMRSPELPELPGRPVAVRRYPPPPPPPPPPCPPPGWNREPGRPCS
jgi:hypothetical protein